MYKRFFKRLLDILFPLIFLIFFLVWIIIGFPIFVQKRPGLNGKIFKFYKFKTLYDAKKKMSEKKRQNVFGTYLRKTGLDELPQLFNVLKNNMSIVGPRPLLIEYLKKYSNYEKQRHLIKPGITGLAQVNPDPSGFKIWKKSIQLDIFYVSNVSFLLDMKILWKTVQVIILNKKQYQDFKKFYE